MREVQYEREDIEKLKKNRNKHKTVKKSGTVLPSVPTDGFSNVNSTTL